MSEAPKTEKVRIATGAVSDHDVADLSNLLAYRMMPRWGQVLSWFLWQLPATWYVALVGGVLWACYRDTVSWKVALSLAVLAAAVAQYARKNVRNPFRSYVIVTRAPVAGADAAAIQRGEVPK